MSRADKDYRGHRQRLRERFERSGREGLADYEFVELLLTLVLPRGDVKPLAKRLVENFENLRGILDAPIDQERTIRGIGTVTPVALQIVRAAADLYLQQKAEHKESFADPEALRRFWRMRIGAIPHEVFEVGYLDGSLTLDRSASTFEDRI